MSFPKQGIVDPKYLLWYWSQLRYQVGATQGHLISVPVVKWDPDHNEYIKQWKYILIFCISLNLPTYKRAQVHNVISSPRQYLYGAAHSCIWSEAHLLQQAFAGESFRKQYNTDHPGISHLLSVFWFPIKTFLFTLLHDVMRAPSPMFHCTACITTAFSKIPEKKMKRNTHNYTDGFIMAPNLQN